MTEHISAGGTSVVKSLQDINIYNAYVGWYGDTGGNLLGIAFNLPCPTEHLSQGNSGLVTKAYGVNDGGIIVGMAKDDNNDFHAALRITVAICGLLRAKLASLDACERLSLFTGLPGFIDDARAIIRLPSTNSDKTVYCSLHYLDDLVI